MVSFSFLKAHENTHSKSLKSPGVLDSIDRHMLVALLEQSIRHGVGRLLVIVPISGIERAVNFIFSISRKRQDPGWVQMIDKLGSMTLKLVYDPLERRSDTHVKSRQPTSSSSRSSVSQGTMPDVLAARKKSLTVFPRFTGSSITLSAFLCGPL